MVKIRNQIKIGKSRKDVFNFLLNFENIPRWNYYVKEVKFLYEKKGKRRFHQIRKGDEQDFEIQEARFPEIIVIETTEVNNKKSIKFRRKFRLKGETKNDCLLEDYFEMDLGYPQLLQRAFKSRIQNSVKQNLDKLKELMEHGKTVLQDGRISKIYV